MGRGVGSKNKEDHGMRHDWNSRHESAFFFNGPTGGEKIPGCGATSFPGRVSESLNGPGTGLKVTESRCRMELSSTQLTRAPPTSGRSDAEIPSPRQNPAKRAVQ